MSPWFWYVAWAGKIDKKDGGFVFSSLVSLLDVDRELGFTDLAYAECSRTSRRVLSFGQPTFWPLLQELLSLRGWV